MRAMKTTRCILAALSITAALAGPAAAAPATTKPNTGGMIITPCATQVPLLGGSGGAGTPTACGSGAIGTAAYVNTGTSGATIPLLNGANTWSGVQTFNNGDFALVDASAAHNVLIQPNSSVALTNDRILTLDLVNAARTLKLGANLTIATDPGAVTGAIKSNGSGTFSQAACADLSTPCITGNQTITLSGDVTGSGTTAITTALANIPTATPMAGSLLATNIAAPSTPAAGKTSFYIDSTSKNLASKNDAGTVNHGIQTRAATANNWIRSIADDGSSTISQPAFTDISGTCTTAQACLGLTTAAVGDIIYASATTPTWSRLADVATGQVLKSGGLNTAPAWGTIACAFLTDSTSWCNAASSTTTFSATPLCPGGSGTLADNGSSYMVSGKMYYVRWDITITAVGTCAGNNLTVALPNSSTNKNLLALFGEEAAVGNTALIQLAAGATTGVIFLGARTSPFVNGNHIIVNGWYEAQ